MRLGVFGVLISAVLLGACGSDRISGGGRGTMPVKGAQTGGPERRVPPDSFAYLEIARASGTLRGSTAAAALGRARSLGARPAVASAARGVDALRPRDPALAGLREQIRSALRAALSAARDPASQRAGALAAVSATDAINRSLRRYAALHPRVQALIPD